ncbi:hypothetical protein OHV05_04475 [Kitasatospora sp. NBC_00070]|uniref:peptidase inhibitor family I36 protein n=1 Tax=Kitasatospora sp. NBC_00070 TaxID=2975962 RepID=UPI003253FE78
MRTTTIRRTIGASTAALAVTLGMLTTPAMAAPSVASSDTRPAIVALTKAQKAELQRAVDAQIKRAAKKGTQTAANEVTYYSADGKVEAVAVLPLPGETIAPSYTQTANGITSDWHGCPTFAYCFYENSNWEGARWQFWAAYEGPPGYASNYGFQDRTSSWVVNTSALYIVADDAAPGGTGQWLWLWTTNPQSSASYVGNTNNDRMDRWWAWVA